MAPNTLDRQFTVDEPNVAWVTDVTFVPTGEGWLYLATILDLYNREVVGWAPRDTNDQLLTAKALRLALSDHKPPAGLLHHSDRGSTYTAGDYRDLLAANGIECSMSRKGDCWDNSPAESFFATLKKELVHPDRYATRAQASIGGVRVHRGVLQPGQAALVARVQKPDAVQARQRKSGTLIRQYCL